MSANFSLPDRLADDPLGLGLVVVPAHVVDQVRHHVHHPAGGVPVDRVHAPDRAAGDDLLDLLVVLAVAVLVADHRLDASFAQQLHDLQRLVGRGRHRLFVGDELHARLDARADQCPAAGWAACRSRRHPAWHRPASARRPCWRTQTPYCRGRRIQPLLVDVAQPDDLEARVRGEGVGVMRAALAQPGDGDGIGLLCCHAPLSSQARTVSIT